MTARQLGALTTIECDGDVTTVLIPVGSCEQHGPHLPLDTDTRVAVAVAFDAASRMGPSVVVAPAVAYGASGEHAGFAGTLSIGSEALEVVLVELVRSAGDIDVVFVNGHGGNVVAVGRAVERLVGEGRRVRWWAPRLGGGDAHAGRTETSLMLAIAPDLVRIDRAQRGNVTPLAELLPALRAGGMAAVSANGVLGDPTGASADFGRAMLDELVADLVDVLSRRP